jgi:hypothetical protein
LAVVQVEDESGDQARSLRLGILVGNSPYEQLAVVVVKKLCREEKSEKL